MHKGKMQVVSFIRDSVVIDKILTHIAKKERAPPKENSGA